MRIIAQNVETYALMRDHPEFALEMKEDSLPPSPSPELTMNGVHGHDLRDSLWFFDGTDVRVWIDMVDVLSSVSIELGRDLPAPVKIPVDFYPLSALINKAVVFGIESELVQRRDTSFAYSRFGTRVCWPDCIRSCIVNCLYIVDSPLLACLAAPTSRPIQPFSGPTPKSSLPTSTVFPTCTRDPPSRSSR
jgi:hypothetical protein